MLCGCGCGCDWSGDGDRACAGARRPRSPGFAGAGIRGIVEPPLTCVAPDVDAVATRDFAATECPGATAETSAAKPAVSAAHPTITQRRVRVTRASAASRASAAPDFGGPWCPSFELTVARENQRPVRAV